MSAEEVWEIVRSLPETACSDGRLGFSVAGKDLAWSWMERIEPKRPRVERRDVLAVRVEGENDKEALIAANPRVYFTEPHYRGFPAILVRLAEIERDELTELLTDAWLLRAPKKLAEEWLEEHAPAVSRPGE